MKIKDISLPLFAWVSLATLLGLGMAWLFS